MGKVIITRKGGGAAGVAGAQTTTPAITLASVQDEFVVFQIQNNDSAEANVYYEIGDSEPRENNVIIGGNTLSPQLSLFGLDPETSYTLFAQAGQEGILYSEVASQAFTTLAPLGFEKYDLITDINVTDTAVGEFVFSNLGLEQGETLRIAINSVSGTSLSTLQNIFINNDVTGSNYRRQAVFLSNSGFSSNAANTANVILQSGIEPSAGYIDVRLTESGAAEIISRYIFRIGNAIADHQMHITNVNTFTSIDTITLSSSRANGFAPGSRVQLFKITEEVV